MKTLGYFKICTLVSLFLLGIFQVNRATAQTVILAVPTPSGPNGSDVATGVNSNYNYYTDNATATVSDNSGELALAIGGVRWQWTQKVLRWQSAITTGTTAGFFPSGAYTAFKTASGQDTTNLDPTTLCVGFLEGGYYQVTLTAKVSVDFLDPEGDVVKTITVSKSAACQVVVAEPDFNLSDGDMDCTPEVRQEVKVVYSERETTTYEPQAPHFYQRLQAASAA